MVFSKEGQQFENLSAYGSVAQVLNLPEVPEKAQVSHHNSQGQERVRSQHRVGDHGAPHDAPGWSHQFAFVVLWFVLETLWHERVPLFKTAVKVGCFFLSK